MVPNTLISMSVPNRVDQNTGHALLKFSVKIVMHGTSPVSSAVSVDYIYQIFTTAYSLEVVALLVRRWSLNHEVRPSKNSSP